MASWLRLGCAQVSVGFCVLFCLQCAGGLRQIESAEPAIPDRCFKVDHMGDRQETDDLFFCFTENTFNSLIYTPRGSHDIEFNSAIVTWQTRSPTRWMGWSIFHGKRIDFDIRFEGSRVTMQEETRYTSFERIHRMIRSNLGCLNCEKDKLPEAVERGVYKGSLLTDRKLQEINGLISGLPEFQATCGKLEKCIKEIPVLGEKGAFYVSDHRRYYADAFELGCSGNCESMRELVSETLTPDERTRVPSCVVTDVTVRGLTVELSPGSKSIADQEKEKKRRAKALNLQ